jgi:hypothetical protein
MLRQRRLRTPEWSKGPYKPTASTKSALTVLGSELGQTTAPLGAMLELQQPGALHQLRPVVLHIAHCRIERTVGALRQQAFQLGIGLGHQR